MFPILEFYISGNRIQRNEFLDLDEFLDELKFFEMEKTILIKQSKTVIVSNCVQRIQTFVKNPDSSKMAHMFSTVSLFFTVWSIIQFCLETVQELNHLRNMLLIMFSEY